MAEMTPCDVMAMTKHHDARRTATTGIGLAAGLGGGALLLAIAGIWGVNAASKARYKAAENLAAGNTKNLDMLAGFVNSERTSRESWQQFHTPSMVQYVSATAQSGAGAGAGAGANAISTAEAIALLNNSGLGAAVSHDSYLKVQRYSAPKGCGCDND